MVFLILVVGIGIPIAFATLKLVALAFSLSSDAFDRVQNGFLRFLCNVGLLAASVGISIPISLAFEPLIPDFRVLGDGGVGMAHNLLSTVALFVAVPCGIMLVTALLLSRTLPVPPVEPTDPFGDNLD